LVGALFGYVISRCGGNSCGLLLFFFLGEPLLFLFALGYGLGQFIGDIQGMSYVQFLITGIVCSSCVFTATLTSFYEAFVRMNYQKTWQAMLSTPLTTRDIVLGEVTWSGTKASIQVVGILIIAAFLSLIASWHAVFVMPIILLLGVSISSMALLVTSQAKNFEFFSYFHTLFVTTMIFISGIYFPMENLPEMIQWVGRVLPLSHAVAVVRPLMTGGVLENVWMHLSIIGAYGLGSYFLVVVLMRRRLLN